MSDISTSRVFRPDPRSLHLREEHHRAAFWAGVTPPAITVSVEGEVDAANSMALGNYVERHVAGSSRLILDLRLVDFFGTAGFAALHNINVVCRRHGCTWKLLAGRQIRRLLEICDPEGILPLEQSTSVLDDVRAGAGDRELLVGGNH
jgi:anti-anti-sigma factor